MIGWLTSYSWPGWGQHLDGGIFPWICGFHHQILGVWLNAKKSGSNWKPNTWPWWRVAWPTPPWKSHRELAPERYFWDSEVYWMMDYPDSEASVPDSDISHCIQSAMITPWKTNMSPEKWWVGRLLSFWNGSLLGDMLVFRGVLYSFDMKVKSRCPSVTVTQCYEWLGLGMCENHWKPLVVTCPNHSIYKEFFIFIWIADMISLPKDIDSFCISRDFEDIYIYICYISIGCPTKWCMKYPWGVLHKMTPRHPSSHPNCSLLAWAGHATAQGCTWLRWVEF